MTRRAGSLLSLVLLLLVAAPASGQSLQDQIDDAQEKLAQAQARERELTAEIASVSQRIRSLEAEVGDVSTRLAVLEEDLELHQRKLDHLAELYRIQSERLAFLRRQYDLAVERLSARLVAVYEGGEPSTLDVLVDASSFNDVLEQMDYLNSIAAQDRLVVRDVTGARNHMRQLRARTGKTKARVAAITQVVRIRTEQQRALKTQLVAQQEGLSTARGEKRVALADAREDAKEHAAHASALQAQSAALASQIRASQASVTYSTTSDSTPSASGFIWPVGGPVTSGYGWRWGRMHEGIDIAAGYGSPIVAAASGTVIYAGWMGGYGNLIIIDHGGGVATAYAHQSSFAIGGGPVSQGQTIGYVGCTGHCFGDHLHFEVRVNGSAVDPLGYL